jgi:nitrogen fixation protein NifB
MPLDLSRHPCFNESSRRTFARIHLPVAPDCNVQCNFCKRMYDCANESRPGVTSALLTPPRALRYLQDSLKRDPRIAVVGVAGPGDPFATPERTLETLRLVREHSPEMLLCVASNGLNVARYADELASLVVSHVTLTINAVEPAIGSQIYAWIRDGKRVYRGLEGATLLWDRQAEAIRCLKQRDVTVKVNTIIVPGVNDHHVVEVARRVAELGADISNCVPLYPVEGTAFGDLESPSHENVAAIRAEVRQYLPTMAHCARCRADAVGLLGEAVPAAAELALLHAATSPGPSSQDRPCVAVATLEGVLVNQHLGEAQRLAIYRQGESGFQLLETRPTPVAGGGRDRWIALAEALHDCRALLVASAGESPRSVLDDRGIQLIFMEGLIEEGLNAVYRGEQIRSPLRKQHRCGSGSGCGGNGQGCM